MNPTEILRTAFYALRGNWMRSALTSLGVIIGIAAVIVMVSVGQGTQAEIDKLVDGKPQAAMVRIGVTDGTSTEVMGSDVHAGDPIIVGAQRSEKDAASQ